MSSSAIIAFITITLLIFSTDSIARELRPSDHGLEYQSLPPTGLKSSPGMMSFFGSSSSSTPNTVALPKAMNSTDTSWWAGGGSSNRRERDHVRHVLLLGSLVCGVTGVALLAASALIYVTKFRSSSSNDNNNTNNVNGLVLVPISK